MTTSRRTAIAPEPEEKPDHEHPLPKDRYLDRELSWLAFNERVLELAEDPNLPLLERANFAAIFANNLDEFFMVRVAGLKRRIATGLAVPSNSGLAPLDMLAEISKAAHALQNRHATLFRETLLPAMEAKGIRIVGWDELDETDKTRMDIFFQEDIFPILTPLAVDPAHPFPYISGLSVNFAVVVENPETGKHEFARVKVPESIPRFISLDEDDGHSPVRFIALDELMRTHLDQLFTGMNVLEAHTFRVTRNEDLEVDEDEAENLLQALEKELLRRRFGPPVRLEVTNDISPEVRGLLVRELGVTENEVYPLPAPLDLTGLWSIMKLDRPALKYPVAVPTTSPMLYDIEANQHSEFWAAIRSGDILLHHPYESFATSVQAFLAHAAADPKVLAIKQTLYRTSGDSPIVQALIDAAQAGKQVLALVEIKARFDEANNISWARKLERAGVHVVYGLVGLKTHCKLSLVIRQEKTGLTRYSHVGTGNYNPKTARLYEDLGLLTADRQVGDDIGRLFNQLSGYAIDTKYKRLLVAPQGLRKGLIKRINQEAQNARNGLPSGIMIKVNALVDEKVIDALYHASNAGVPIKVWVRGICSLRPGQPGLSENITVRSILGRYLEHSRVFWFLNENDPIVYIGSADMMHRNLDRRVETLVRLTSPDHIKELSTLITTAMSPEVSSWHLDSAGVWTRHTSNEATGRRLKDLQTWLIQSISARDRRRSKRK
ncbi:MAG TPA: RNA degradosome polyphosphate kinase [Pseudoclavibacter sp.]|nr:RNA degradosome polyphosphate kinase [Pseudoclavibacter sp.]